MIRTESFSVGLVCNSHYKNSTLNVYKITGLKVQFTLVGRGNDAIPNVIFSCFKFHSNKNQQKCREGVIIVEERHFYLFLYFISIFFNNERDNNEYQKSLKLGFSFSIKPGKFDNLPALLKTDRFRMFKRSECRNRYERHSNNDFGHRRNLRKNIEVQDLRVDSIEKRSLAHLIVDTPAQHSPNRSFRFFERKFKQYGSSHKS